MFCLWKLNGLNYFLALIRNIFEFKRKYVVKIHKPDPATLALLVYLNVIHTLVNSHTLLEWL